MLEEKDLQAIAQLILASEERLRAEFHAKLEMEIRASEERMREGMSAEFHAGENRTHAYIENGVMKPIRLLAEGHAQILERWSRNRDTKSTNSSVHKRFSSGGMQKEESRDFPFYGRLQLWNGWSVVVYQRLSYFDQARPENFSPAFLYGKWRRI